MEGERRGRRARKPPVTISHTDYADVDAAVPESEVRATLVSASSPCERRCTCCYSRWIPREWGGMGEEEGEWEREGEGRRGRGRLVPAITRHHVPLLT